MPAAPTYPAAPPTATGFVPSNLTPTLQGVDADVPAVYADGCHHDTEEIAVQHCVYGNPEGTQRVALFGDSHSAQWLPALEEIAKGDEELEIRTFSKSSCPAVDVTVLVKNVPYASCDTWRNSVIDALRENPPDLVVISSYSGYALDGNPVGSARLDRWSGGLERTVASLREVGSDVLVIADTPRFESAPANCVSSHPSDVDACAGDRASVLDGALAAMEQAASESAGGRFVDLTGFICNERTCPTIVDDLLVYRDVNHLTSTFARYLAPALSDSLRLDPVG